jgi:hypothetical protein
VDLWAAQERFPADPQPKRGGRKTMDLPKARLAWVELYADTGDAGLVCRLSD